MLWFVFLQISPFLQMGKPAWGMSGLDLAVSESCMPVSHTVKPFHTLWSSPTSLNFECFMVPYNLTNLWFCEESKRFKLRILCKINLLEKEPVILSLVMFTENPDVTNFVIIIFKLCVCDGLQQLNAVLLIRWPWRELKTIRTRFI